MQGYCTCLIHVTGALLITYTCFVAIDTNSNRRGSGKSAGGGEDGEDGGSLTVRSSSTVQAWVP